ncbi:hypothetical protein F9K94_00990 [Brucella tritici]|uniref:Uncharacterized protein n=1 Tax=Brucella tritici TaxID=94626 RepID=A0A7V7VWX6_9HYPH|nr:hypothetical protein [Brucella tritici]KAB2658807.1 hypothetical protein F9K94_00990 [Brucella tritici]
MRKTIHYRRVEWFNQQANDNVVALLGDVLAARQHIEQTRFAIADETCEIRHRDQRGNLVCLHLSTYVNGSRKGVTPQAQGVANGDLDEALAPDGAEFTEREIALVIGQQAVAFVTHGFVHPKFVERAIRGLIFLEHGADVSNRFSLAARADPAVINRLLEEGVQYLDMGISLNQVDAINQIEGQPQPITTYLARTIKDAISARFEDEFSEEEVDNLAMANAHLVLNFKKSAPLDQIESLTTLAEDVIEGDDDFKIKTIKGNYFTRDQLLLKNSYNQPGRAAYLSYALAWDNSVQFLNDVE